MGRFLFGLLLWGATLVRAEVSVRDTVVNGVPYIRFMAGPGHPGDLKIAMERGELRASLEGMADSVLVVFDRNPFAQMAGRTRPLVLPPRVTPTRMVLPKATAAALLERLELGASSPAPVPEPTAQVAAAKNAKPMTESVKPPEPGAPAAPRLPEGVVANSEPVQLEPAVSDAPVAEPAAAEAESEPPTEPEPVETTYPRHEPKGTFTVVIDAGHGGKDPGAIGKLKDGNDLYEKTVTLQVARKLRDALQKHKGIKVVMTRDKDEFLELSQRTKLANAAKGELFVSLHCNSIPLNSKRREEVKGFMVYLLREAKDDNDRAIERRENEAIKYETGDRAKKQSLDPVEWMMLEHQLNLYTKESERLAGLVVKTLSKEGTVEKERTGAGQAGFFVLVGALMPSVLVEMGYLSNSVDAAILNDPAKQKRIADNLAKAIDEFRRTRR